MSAQHTPGPWSKGCRGMDEWWIGPSDEATGLPLPVAYVDRNHPQADENARLLIAAPDMLQALREAEAGLELLPESQLKQVGDFVPSGLLALRAVRAAIAKATGSAL